MIAAPVVPLREIHELRANAWRARQAGQFAQLIGHFPAQVLRRHLRVAHNLEVADYRARWKLREDHPIIAPNYSARRSTMDDSAGDH
jgi:hypothetical protein